MNCWFCSVREADQAHTFYVEMYGDVDTKEMPSQTQIAYSVRHIDVPRCAECHSRHSIARFAAIVAWIMLFSEIAAILFAVMGEIPDWAWGIWAGLSAGLLIGALASRFLVLKGSKTIHRAKTSFPEIKELLEKGYRFGRHPKGQLPKSD
ncbi:MAG: hypothetical protein KBG64_00345 [Clostridia bacterium]|nr:hypothetical protein [Clostridia bacterium]